MKKFFKTKSLKYENPGIARFFIEALYLYYHVEAIFVKDKLTIRYLSYYLGIQYKSKRHLKIPLKAAHKV